MALGNTWVRQLPGSSHHRDEGGDAELVHVAPVAPEAGAHDVNCALSPDASRYIMPITSSSPSGVQRHGSLAIAITPESPIDIAGIRTAIYPGGPPAPGGGPVGMPRSIFPAIVLTYSDVFCSESVLASRKYRPTGKSTVHPYPP